MEARDLRIGNLIKDCEGVIFRVAGMPQNGGVNITADSTTYKIDVFLPVPLTEDILLKCGFELKGDVYTICCEDGWCYLIIDKGDMSASIQQDDEDIRHDYPCLKLSTTQYLHQLQNLYFALTGEELNIQL